jgi:PAS domain S-box-containing protein
VAGTTFLQGKMVIVRHKAFLLAGCALLILFGAIVLSWEDWKIFRGAMAEARHARSVLDSNETLLSALKDAETGERGFLITGDKAYLEPYHQASDLIPGALAQLSTLTQDDPPQADRLKLIAPLVSEKLAQFEQAIEIMQRQGSAAAADFVRTGRAKRTMDRIRELSAAIKSEESASLTGRREALDLHGQRTRLATLLGDAVLFVLLLIAGGMIAKAGMRSDHLIGELRVSERRTAQVRDLMKITLASIGDAVVVTDAQGRVTFINPVAQRLTRFTQEAAIGQPVTEIFRIVNETTRNAVESPVSRVLREGTIVGLANHTVLLARDGQEIPIDDSGAPIRDRQGSVIGVVLVFRDISARKKAEEASLRLASIVEFSGDAIVSQRLDGILLSWNAAATRMFGYSEAEMVGQKLSILAIEQNIDDPEHVLERLRGGESAVYYEAVRHRKDGSLIEIAAVASPVRDSAGNLIGVSRICRDVTESKRTLQALRESEEHLRLSAEAAELGVWRRDLATGRLSWSPQLESIFGLAPGASPRNMEQFLALVHPEDRRRVSEEVARATEANREFDVEFRTIQPNGEIRSVLSRGRPLFSEGKASGLAGITMDITNRRRLEQKMQQAQKLESLGILAGGIAHDFNNLLVGILGNASLLKEETPPDSPLRPITDNLMQASERAAHLTRQMLAYSGKGRFVVERLDLALQVQQILALIDASIDKSVKVELNFQPHLPPVEGDAGQIQQLIMNLVINGAEATGTGGGMVTISAILREIGPEYVRDNLSGDNIRPGSYVCLEVHDNGAGMDAATQARIFDPFFTTKFTGRGLGLAAVLGIVRGHHGALTVYSEPGKGTSFKIFFPAARMQQPDAVKPAPSSEFRGEGTILVIDDEEMVQRTLKAALERYGYTVLAASGGREAIDIFKQKQNGISLILLDMTMPVMSGEETLQALLAIRRDVPVIATSGYNEMEALRRFGEGLSGFIQKPYTPRSLAEKINGVLRQKSVGRSAP